MINFYKETLLKHVEQNQNQYLDLPIKIGKSSFEIPIRIENSNDVYPNLASLEKNLQKFILELGLHRFYPDGEQFEKVLGRIMSGRYASLIGLVNATPFFLRPENQSKLQLLADFLFFTFLIDDQNESASSKEEADKNHSQVIDILSGAVELGKISPEKHPPHLIAAANIRKRLLEELSEYGIKIVGPTRVFLDSILEQFSANLTEVSCKTQNIIPSEKIYDARRQRTAGVKPFFALTDLLLGVGSSAEEAGLSELESLIFDSVASVNDIVSANREAKETIGKEKIIQVDPEVSINDQKEIFGKIPLNGVWIRSRDRNISPLDSIYSKAMDHKEILEEIIKMSETLIENTSDPLLQEAIMNRVRWASVSPMWYILTDRYL